MLQARLLVLITLLLLPVSALWAQSDGLNLILVTLDGVRWQEVFRGPQTELVENESYTSQSAAVNAQFAGATARENAETLLPFLHTVIEQQGVLIGNRDALSCARVSNPWYFSYPGYNEILTGKADPDINSNDPVPNKNITFLEWLNHEVSAYQGKVKAFASWDVFPAIINEQRSGVPVNVGPAAHPLNDEERLINRLHQDLPHLWSTVRLDALTHMSALENLRSQQSKVLYISYGETDDFAHDGHYDQYLFAAHRADAFLRELWETVQSMEGYRDNTVLFVTTDHGRGSMPLETWQHHASRAAVQSYMPGLSDYENGIEGSDAVWMAALGPGIKAAGLVQTGDNCVTSSQIAATLLTLMGLDYHLFDAGAGQPLAAILQQER